MVVVVVVVVVVGPLRLRAGGRAEKRWFALVERRCDVLIYQTSQRLPSFC